MLPTLAVSALLGLTVSAAPNNWGNGHKEPGHYPGGEWHGGQGHHGGYGGHEGDNSTGQVPFKFPLENGFPDIKVPSDALTAIQKQAHGTLPNGALPTKLADASATNFQLIAFNEIFEVAYFTSLIKNITDGTYDIGKGAAKQIVLNALTAVQAQEELHALGANAILASANRTTVKPCEYVFPVADFDSAIATASLFTDVVLGTLQGAQSTFAANGDDAVIGLIGSVIGQEGEQNGFYRATGGKIPSALPFLTASAGPFAFSALNQLFVVPGSCGNLDAIQIPIFAPLTVATKDIQLKDQTLKFQVTVDGNTTVDGLSVAYINQQNTPVVVKPTNIQTQGSTVTFEAPFEAEKNLANGLTIAALTKSAGPFADAAAVAADTVFGPGLIEIN